MSVYLVIQTRNVPATDYVVAICQTKKIAELWVTRNCHQFGDCVSPLTKNFIKPSYKDYSSGNAFYYMYKNNPALLIQEYKFIIS